MIYHICRAEIWNKDKDSGRFGKDELEKYGFIHSSTAKGIERIIDRYRDDAQDYLVLCINEDSLKDQIRYETKDPDHLFPHFVKLIDNDQILSVMPLNNFLKSYKDI